MSTTSASLLQKWYPRVTGPFIANAPMYGSADAALAAAVSKAGGYGFIACGFDFSEKSEQISVFEDQLCKARSLLFIKDQNAPLPIGVGFITLRPAGFIENLVPILIKHRVSGVWLSFPTKGEDHKDFISAVHAAREKYAWDVRVWVQVGNVESAREAIDQGADVLVVQGVDAGGHQWTQGASIVVLVPEVRNLVEEMGKGGDVAVLAAGGIVNGRGLAAALSLGADGIVMGTRFLCTSECSAPAFSKQQITSTKEGVLSTIKSKFHDDVQDSGLWPAIYDARALIGPAYKDHVSGLDLSENISVHRKAAEEGDPQERRIVFAGAGVGLIKETLSVQEVTEKTQNEAREIMRSLSAYGI